MGAAFRRSGKVAVATTMVVILLVASALLAAGLAAPQGGAYPATQVRINGSGFCGGRFAHTRFAFTVQRKASGQLRGELLTQLGHDSRSFHGEQLQVLNAGTHAAAFTIAGKLVGSHNKDKGTYSAHVTLVDGHPDRITISVIGTSEIYSKECALTTGGIVFTTR